MIHRRAELLVRVPCGRRYRRHARALFKFRCAPSFLAAVVNEVDDQPEEEEEAGAGANGNSDDGVARDAGICGGFLGYFGRVAVLGRAVILGRTVVCWRVAGARGKDGLQDLVVGLGPAAFGTCDAGISFGTGEGNELDVVKAGDGECGTYVPPRASMMSVGMR